jgi:hypothetical protein
METKTKTFDAVEESRKWREATSRRLNAMSRDARIAHLNALGEKVRAELRPKPRLATAASC